MDIQTDIQKMIKEEERFLNQVVSLRNDEKDPYFKKLYDKDLKNSKKRLKELKKH